VFTGVRKKNKKSKNRELSSELIYCYMAEYRLPWYAEKWHLSRLLTMIQVADDLHSGEDKMNKKEVMSHYAKLNEMNRRRFHSKG
jgi:hypothetical protein